MEHGESLESALKREIREELSAEIKVEAEYPLPKESTLRNSPPSDKTEKCTRCVQGIPSYRINSLDESWGLDQLLIGSAPPPSFRQ